jgi:hypothetical protein
MSPDPWWEGEEWADRLEEKLAQLGTRIPRCRWQGCRERCPFAFTGVDPDIECYEHAALAAGRHWLEEHHLAGRRNDPRTVLLPGNEHRILSELQYLWPLETLRNPDGSPLLWAAALVRGWSNVLFVVIVVIAGVPVFLEQLDEWLREEIGPRWWEGFAGADG